MSNLSTYVLATEGEGSAAELLLPAWPELVAGVIAFSLVYFFVWKWVWPSLNKTIEARQAAVVGQMEAAERAKAEAESLLSDYRAQLAASKAEANRIMEEARAAAEQMRADVMAKAQADADQIRAKAREEAAAEMSRALAEARNQVGEISIDLAGKIVGESLDAASHKALIDRYLADLERL
jgi:F-type H+-transporting ATPase subunit b